MTVAIVALKTVQNAAFLAWLDKRGADAKSVKMFEMPLPEMGTALETGRVDAAITVEPFTTRNLAANRSFGTVYDAMGLPFMVFAMCTTDQYLTANTATAVKFAGAIRQAAAWANAHEKDCRAILGTALKLEPQVTSAMLMPVNGTAMDAASIQPVMDVMVKYGFLERAVPAADMLWRAPA
jgi:ABC-type nitrate/sulfonate/bicarbonate transport system substrate-binding protein